MFTANQSINLLIWLVGVGIFFTLSSPNTLADDRGDTMPKEYQKPALEELRNKLTEEQFRVTQHEGTERPFANEYWDNKRAGIYVDVVTGEPLFSSIDKFDSGTGWPSFTKPIEKLNIEMRRDQKLFMERTEVRSKRGDSHLGHVFNDGPGPEGTRFCINSAALRFIPAEELTKEGYDSYTKLFPGVIQVGVEEKSSSISTLPMTEDRAVLAGGCFWGMEDLLRTLPGVISTRVGYAGGNVAHATYDLVRSGRTNHAEAVEVTFDSSKLSYSELLRFFYRIHDPTTKNQQGNDRGTQYRSAIFVTNEVQRKVAEQVTAEINKAGKWKKPIVTEITEAGPFWEAEEYHQDYLLKNPGGYTCHFIRD